jgi:hypothetical protein
VCWDIPIKRGFRGTTVCFQLFKIILFYIIFYSVCSNMSPGLNTSIIGLRKNSVGPTCLYLWPDRLLTPLRTGALSHERREMDETETLPRNAAGPIVPTP